MAAPEGAIQQFDTVTITARRYTPSWFIGGKNPLEYAQTYSYTIVLRAYNDTVESKFITPDQLNDPSFLEKNTRVLASSGGTAQWPNRYGSNDQLGDAFVESMSMKVTNGLNAGNGGRISPVTEFKLTVVETGGAEFIAAMMAGNSIVNKQADADGVTVMSESPFLISIYYNMPDLDESLRSLGKTERKEVEDALQRSSVRHMKIRINKVNFSVKSTGVTYELIGTPYSHYALTDTVQSASYQQGYTLEGSTIDDYVQHMTRIFNDTVKQTNTDNKGNFNGAPYTYEFKYHGDIAEEFKKATLSFEQGSNLNNLPISQVADFIPTENDSANTTAATQKGAVAQQRTLQNEQGSAGKKRTLSVEPKMGVPELLEKLAFNSTFVSSYFSDKNNIPVEVPFIRVIPIISTPKPDNVSGTNTVKKLVTYNIVGIKVPVLRNATTDKTKADDLKRHFDTVKRQTRRHYDYLFTGGNSSILNMDIRYDNMYVQSNIAWSKHHANTSTQATSAGTGSNGEGATNPATTPAKNLASNKDKPDSKNLPVPSQNQPTTLSPVMRGMPKDFKGTADQFRALLSDIFNDTPERAQIMVQLEIIGDPDLFTPVDAFNSQEDFETVSKAAFDPQNDKILNPFEPYYFHINIGNQASQKSSFKNIQFGGFYMPLSITHNWPNKGKYTNTIMACKVLGSDLKLIRAGQSGYGYLIEHDAGYISPDEPRNQPFINEMKKLDVGKLAIVEPLIVYVVLQKHGILNRNGRVYPEAILRKQDQLYQQAIRERRAVGELDHPESSVIAGDRISHNIIETWWENHTLMGKMEILMTPGFINLGIVSTKGDEVANKRWYLIGDAFKYDSALLLEWKVRFTLNFAACRGVFSQTFQNNWVNGVLYMFSFNTRKLFGLDPNNPNYTSRKFYKSS